MFFQCPVLSACRGSHYCYRVLGVGSPQEPRLYLRLCPASVCSSRLLRSSHQGMFQIQSGLRLTRYVPNSVRAPSHQGMLRILSGLHLTKVCSEFCQGSISARYALNSVRAPSHQGMLRILSGLHTRVRGRGVSKTQKHDGHCLSVCLSACLELRSKAIPGTLWYTV